MLGELALLSEPSQSSGASTGKVRKATVNELENARDIEATIKKWCNSLIRLCCRFKIGGSSEGNDISNNENSLDSEIPTEYEGSPGEGEDETSTESDGGSEGGRDT